jgi:hypothetical protein
MPPSRLSLQATPEQPPFSFKDLCDRPVCGWTPRELARLLRISPDRVRGFIRAGELKALNVASTRSGRPRFVILPHHLAEFEQRRQAVPPSKPPRRRRQPAVVDYFPD